MNSINKCGFYGYCVQYYTLYLYIYSCDTEHNTNPSSIAIHVPGESFNDILGRFIVFDHTLLRNTTKVVEWFLHDIAKTKLKKHIKQIEITFQSHKIHKTYNGDVITIDMTYQRFLLWLLFLCQLNFDWYQQKPEASDIRK